MSQPLSGGDINTLSISDFRNSNVWVFLPFDSCILKTVREERVGILHKENFIRSIKGGGGGGEQTYHVLK